MLAATEPAASWPLLVAGVALGLLAVWAGVRCWTGRWPGPFGPRPLYQSFYGGAHLGVPVGLWAVLLAGGEVVRAGLGLDRDGPFFTAVSVVSSVIGAAALVYALAYLQWVDEGLDGLVHRGIDEVQERVPLGPFHGVVDTLQDGFDTLDRYGDTLVDGVQRVTSPDFWGDVVGDWIDVDGPEGLIDGVGDALGGLYDSTIGRLPWP